MYFPATHGATLVKDKDYILGYCGQTLGGKVVHEVAVLNLWPEGDAPS